MTTILNIIDAPGEPLRLTALSPQADGSFQFEAYELTDEMLYCLAGKLLKAAEKRLQAMKNDYSHHTDSDWPVAPV